MTLIRIKFLSKYFLQVPTLRDVIVLFCFAVLITFQPYFLYGQINVYEVGLYLPGINALLHGLVPFRDFFHLRGPFELYMPSFLMSIFGANIAVLSVYFYVGTILTLVFCILVGKELFRSRLILYLFVFVLIARTFPRVVFTYWGGIRYGFGILVLYFVAKYFKTERPLWMFFAGLGSAIGFLTSIEIGVCLIAGILVAFLFSWISGVQEKKKIRRAFLCFILGAALVKIPYFSYLVATHSFVPYLESVYAVVVHKDVVIDPHIISPIPSNLLEALTAMLVVTGKNFRHMTSSYLYLVLLFYFVYRIRQAKLEKTDLSVVAIAVYGVVMYNTAFRNIWAAQFEMALQPEKILFFFILERVYLFLTARKSLMSQDVLMGKLKKWGINVLIFGVIASSIGYSFDRYNKRFFTFQYLRNRLIGKETESLKPLAKIPTRELTIARAKGMVVPIEQADELEAIVDFFNKNTAADEAVFMYPELGTYSFLIDRPFVGRFPISTFSWFNDRWYEELMADFIKAKPRFVVMPKEFPINWKEVYLASEINRKKYDGFIRMIKQEYTLRTQTPQSYIYIRRDKG